MLSFGALSERQEKPEEIGLRTYISGPFAREACVREIAGISRGLSRGSAAAPSLAVRRVPAGRLAMDPASVDAVVLQYLKKKGYTQAEAALKSEAKVGGITLEELKNRCDGPPASVPRLPFPFLSFWLA